MLDNQDSLKDSYSSYFEQKLKREIIKIKINTVVTKDFNDDEIVSSKAEGCYTESTNDDDDGECNGDGFGNNSGLVVNNLTIDGSGNKNLNKVST